MRDYNKESEKYVKISLAILAIAFIGVVIGYIIDLDFHDLGVDGLFSTLFFFTSITSSIYVVYLMWYLIYYGVVKKEEFKGGFFALSILFSIMTFCLSLWGLFMVGLDAWASSY